MIDDEESLNNSIFILHYGSNCIMITSDYNKALSSLAENQELYKALPWRISSITEYGDECWKEGADSGCL